MLMNRFGIAIIITLALVVVYAIVTIMHDQEVDRKYQTAFDETKIGEPLNKVLFRFGEPSDVAGHIQPGEIGRMPPCEKECWLRLWYMTPILGGVTPYSIDFDIDQRAIGKYHWSSP